MALKLPRWLARFNKAVVNPLQGSYAWLLPPWAVICHRGRRSGRLHRTPVNAYRWRRVLTVVVLYGEDSDWVQNVLAGGAQVVRMGRTYALRNPRIVDPRQQPLLGPAAVLGRLTGSVLVAEVGLPERGFGRGPRAT
jgi:deazaflavin-dependent oxidoreductase (nitroreductase family)